MRSSTGYFFGCFLVDLPSSPDGFLGKAFLDTLDFFFSWESIGLGSDLGEAR